MVRVNNDSASSKQPALMLSVVPIEEETDDLDSWAIAAQVQDQLASTFKEEGAFAVSRMSLPQEEAGARGLEVVLWLMAIGEAISTNQEVLAAFIQLLETVIQTLAKHRRIQHVELSVGEHKLVLKDVREQIVRETLTAFVHQLPSSTPSHPAALPPVSVVARSSRQKKGRS